MPLERPTYCGVIFALALALVGSVVRPAHVQAGQTARRVRPLPPPAPLPAEAAWTVDLPAAPAAGGAMDAERVYVPTQGGQLVALARETGDLVWSADLPTALPPIVSEGRVLASTTDAVVALDAATGARRWTTATDAPAVTIGTSPDGRVVVAVGRTQIEALRADDGRRIWRRALQTTGHRLLATTDPDAAYVATGEGRIVSVSMTDGSGRWDRTFPGELGQPLAAAGGVYVGSTDNRFHALDAGTGDVRWSWRTGGDVVGAAASSQLLFFVALDNILRAVNQGNGHQRWKQALSTRPVAPPLAVPGHVLVPGIDPALSAFDAVAGTPGGTFDAPRIGDAGAAAELLGPPLVEAAPRPFRVSTVLLLRDGRVTGLRPHAMLFAEPPATPLLTLPGRPLGREPAPRPR